MTDRVAAFASCAALRAGSASALTGISSAGWGSVEQNGRAAGLVEALSGRALIVSLHTAAQAPGLYCAAAFLAIALWNTARALSCSAV